MAILLVQLCDLHASSDTNPVMQRWTMLCRAVDAELQEDIDSCVIVFCGDAALGGRREQFSIVTGLLKTLEQSIRQKRPNIDVQILSVPGNHDCDLTSEDQEARVTLRQKVFSQRPSGSIERILLEPQQEYFKFSAQICGERFCGFSNEHPFYRFCDISVSNRILRFHLLNTSWTSIIHETVDLRYPIGEFMPPPLPVADFAITVMHHPLHWFLMPEVRRDLRDVVEGHSDLVLTGHEHENESSFRKVDQGVRLNYLEGGVLQESARPDLCSFNIVRLDFDADKRLVKQFHWLTNHFEVEGDPSPDSLMLNSLRRDRKLRLTNSFEKTLEELEDLVNHPRAGDIRLSNIFCYPDLRKHQQKATETEDKNDESTKIAVRIRSDRVLDEITRQRRTMLLGGDKSGKTSLARRIFSDIHRSGKAPVFWRGGDLSSSGSVDGLKRTLAKLLKDQYQKLCVDEYMQLPEESRVLVLDDFQEGPSDASVRDKVLRFFADAFHQIIIISSNEFYLEVLTEHGKGTAELVSYDLYDICDFGQARLHELAERWVTLRNSDIATEQLKDDVAALCEKVELVLGTAGLPHTPWLLIVIIDSAEGPEAPSSKNGAYGKLYEAVITVALSRSLLKHPDADGKYVYLAELAHHMHSLPKPTLNDGEARAFHDAHCKRYDLTIGYEKLRDDLVTIRILRVDGDTLAFRHKYVYCFFVAYWLQRNIHKESARAEIHQLSERLHHDVSSNVLVMLASLTQDPVVLTEMRRGASGLFKERTPAMMEDDVAALNSLEVPDSFFTLPPTPPEINRQMLREAQDEDKARRGNENQDGRLVAAVPDGEDAERNEFADQIKRVRAATRTIDILGQVLRNGASSQTADEKLGIMEEILHLGRRLLSELYSLSESDLKSLIAIVEASFLKILKDQDGGEGGTTGSQQSATVNMGAPGGDKTSLEEQARLFSNQFFFGIFAMGSAGVVKRMGIGVGMKALDPTINRLLVKDSSLPNKLVSLEMRLTRRDRHIPADEIVDLHKALKDKGNKLARTVLEAIIFERLVMFETHYQDTQKVSRQLNMKRIPAKTYDPNSKKFTPG